MLKIMVTSVIPTKFQKGSWGGWLRFSTLLALVPLVAGPILGTPTFAQESKPTAAQERKIETDFEQGSKTYPAHILLDRVAIVLADEVLANADLYREVIKKLGGKPILGLSRNIIGIAVPDAEDVASLRKFINELIASRPDLIKYTVDTGILVTFGAPR